MWHGGLSGPGQQWRPPRIFLVLLNRARGTGETFGPRLGGPDAVISVSWLRAGEYRSFVVPLLPGAARFSARTRRSNRGSRKRLSDKIDSSGFSIIGKLEATLQGVSLFAYAFKLARASVVFRSPADWTQADPRGKPRPAEVDVLKPYWTIPCSPSLWPWPRMDGETGEAFRPFCPESQDYFRLPRLDFTAVPQSLFDTGG